MHAAIALKPMFSVKIRIQKPMLFDAVKQWLIRLCVSKGGPYQQYKINVFFGLLSIGLAFFLFVESSHPPLEIFGKIPGLDKVAHFFAFFILSFFLYLAIFNFFRNKLAKLSWIVMLAVAVLGVAEECYQMTKIERTASIQDLAADVSGGLVAVFLFSRCHILNKLKKYLA
ncbi:MULTISPECIES: VanZ family protein [Methylomonas]|uniref:VanZ-like domain-containing protein n=1 Tax=Methylomonas koyamae TaxID=702114 RepID=A0AA91I5T0_9GAMM|nr:MULTISPECIES: VanZ family protein [Methylomonas]ANE53883.1 hypothetical protein AYM39_00910 [Methylomonas sp. DH-1]OAI27198.1 hypothetical protein A1356_09965 [Methylomonas koyamae]WNB76169.1 VanZ family protein [Methylomonas koyamae]